MEDNQPHNFLRKNSPPNSQKRGNQSNGWIDKNTAVGMGKLPPQATDLEEAILGALMLEKDALNAIVDILKPESFYKESHQRIYAAIITLFQNSEPVDLLTVTNQLRKSGDIELIGGAGFITQLTSNINSAANIEFHARIVAQASMKRDLIGMASGILKDAYEDTTDVFTLLDRSESDLFKISDSNIKKNYADMGTLMAQALKELELRRDQKDGVTGVPSGFTALDRVTSGWQRTELVILAARPGMGKCLGKGTKVLLFDGKLKKVEDVVIGDLLMGDDSTARQVKSIARGRENMYWIRQNSGKDYRVNESHILSLKRSRTEGAHHRGDVLNITVRDYLTKSDKFKSNYKGYKVAVEFAEKQLSVEPYFMGLWLGNNNDSIATNGQILNIDKQKLVGIYNSDPKSLGFAIRKTDQVIFENSEKWNVLENKHIPNDFICNSRQNRLELLAGLIDSDGHYAEQSNGYEITQKSLELAQQIKFLCDSLGFRTSLNAKKASIKSTGFESEVYRVRIYGNVDTIPVRIERKKARSWQSPVDWRVTGIEVEFDKEDDYYGFEIDGNRLFLLEDMTVTHNTAFVVSSLRNAAVDFNMPVAIFSLEMSSVQLVNRLISAEAEIEGEKIRKGSLLPHEWTQMHHRIDRLMRAPIFIDDTPALSILELRAKARRLKQQHDIQMIVIDYLQLMQGESKGMGNREQEIASISRALKNLAKELNVPVIALSQLNRSVETRGGDKRPQLSDLRESGSIEQDADMVIFLYRPEYYGITQDEEGQSVQGIGEVILAKNRSGSLETVQLRFIGKYTKFADLDSYYSPSQYTPPASESRLGISSSTEQPPQNQPNTAPPAPSGGTFRSRANDLGNTPFPAANPNDETPF